MAQLQVGGDAEPNVEQEQPAMLQCIMDSAGASWQGSKGRTASQHTDEQQQS